jgi:hypothetical protein
MTNLSINDKSYTGPSSWDEIQTTKQYLRLFKLSRVAVRSTLARFHALKLVYGIPRKVSKLFFENNDRIPEESDFLSPSDRAVLLGEHLMETVQWVWNNMPLRKFRYQAIRILGRKFYGPGDSFSEMKFGQYMFVERFFEALQKDSQDYKTNMHLFLASLYRRNNNVEWSKNEIDRNLWWVRWLSPKKQEAIVHNYAGIRYQLTQDFPDVFPKPVAGATETVKAKNASGWLDIVLSISEKNIEMLYTYEKADLFLVMKVLTNTIRQNKEIQASAK